MIRQGNANKAGDVPSGVRIATQRLPGAQASVISTRHRKDR